MEKYNLTIHGRIGLWPNYGSIVRDEVNSLKGKPINVYLNSPGGSVTDALEMYQAFKEHGDVTVHIFGFTASAATLLAMGAKTINMSANALLLIHKASLFQDFWGSMNSDQLDAAIAELEKTKDTLDKVDEIIANIYAIRAGGKKDDFLAKMKKAEWLRASDVKDIGLCDNIIEDASDKAQNFLTNEIKHDFAEMHLPLPDESLLPKDEKNSFLNTLTSVLEKMGFKPKSEKNLTELNNQLTMNKEFACINAALGIEGVEANKDGQVMLTVDQLKKINDAMTAIANGKKKAEDDVAAKTTEIEALNKKVADLEKGDGDETQNNEGGQASDVDNISNAAKMYAEIKDYL